MGVVVCGRWAELWRHGRYGSRARGRTGARRPALRFERERALVVLVWAAALLAVVLTMAVAPAFDGPGVVRRSGMSTPGAAARQLQDRIAAALAAVEAGDAAAQDAAWQELQRTASMADAALMDMAPDGRPLAAHVRAAAGPVRAAVAYVSAGAALRHTEPAQAAERLRRAQQLLAPVGKRPA